MNPEHFYFNGIFKREKNRALPQNIIMECLGCRTQRCIKICNPLIILRAVVTIALQTMRQKREKENFIATDYLISQDQIAEDLCPINGSLDLRLAASNFWC